VRPYVLPPGGAGCRRTPGLSVWRVWEGALWPCECRNNQTQLPNIPRMYQEYLAERQRRDEALPPTETVRSVGGAWSRDCVAAGGEADAASPSCWFAATQVFRYEELQVEMRVVTTLQAAYRRLNRVFADYKTERRGPTAVVRGQHTS